MFAEARVARAVVTIDLQYEFLDPFTAGVGHLEKGVCVSAVRSLLRVARDHAFGILHVRSVHDGVETVPRQLRETLTSGYCLRGSQGSELLDGLAVEGDLTIEKQHYSALADTDLARHLEGVKQVVLTGLAVDCCVLATAFDIAQRTDAELVVPFQTVSATSAELYLAGLEMIAKSLGSVVDLRQFCDGERFANPRPLNGPELTKLARPWIQRQLARASAIAAGGRSMPGPVQPRVDALLMRLEPFEPAAEAESHLPATE